MARSIADIMTTELVMLQRSASVEEAAKQMKQRDIGDVIVLDGDDLYGIATDRDIVVRCIAEGKAASDCEIQEIATTGLQTLQPSDDVGTAVRTMTDADIRRLPIVEDGRPVGIVTIGDLAVEQDSDSALADISAADPNN